MRTPYPLGGLRIAGVFALAFLAFASLAHGLKIKTERVDFGHKTGEAYDGQPIPFEGKGEKRTTFGNDGKPTKFEWIKDGEPQARVEVFVDNNPKTGRTTITEIYKREDGTQEYKGEQVYENSSGKLLFDKEETFDSKGQLTHAHKGGYKDWEEGRTQEWEEYEWDPKFEQWNPVSSEYYEPGGPKLKSELRALEGKWDSTWKRLPPWPRSASLPMDKIKIVDIAGTGETIGHVAMMTIQNLTDQPLSFALPGIILESKSGKSQHYGCPNGQQVALKPNQTLTVPIDGVCLNRDKPPVGNGVGGDLVINDANAQKADTGFARVHAYYTLQQAKLNQANTDEQTLQTYRGARQLLDPPQKEVLVQFLDNEIRQARQQATSGLAVGDQPITEIERAKMAAQLFGQSNLPAKLMTQGSQLKIPANNASQVLQMCRAKHQTIENLQKDDAIWKDFPYKDKKKQRDVLMQWSTWMDPRICEMTGSAPATKDDLKKVVYKQVEEKGPMTAETKKKVDQGVDMIFEKVELTTAKAKDLEGAEPSLTPTPVEISS